MNKEPELEDLQSELSALEDKIDGALAVAQNALQQNADLQSQIDGLEAKNERLEFRIAELELKGEQKVDKEYKLLSREEKHELIIDDLLRRARAVASGKAKVEYSDVMHGTFNSKPSPDHCYTLMAEVGDRDGFEYNDTPANGNIHLRVDLANVSESLAAKADAQFSLAKKEETQEAD